MELHSSKRIKAESEPSSSQQELVGSNLLHDITSLDNSSEGLDPDLVFEALRWTSIFVDKTMLIRSIWKDEHRILLTAPPRFGKTMANNMLQAFFEIGDREQKLEKYKLFKDLKIYKCTEECTDNHDCESKRFFREHCAQHPVLSLDFAGLSATSYSKFLTSFRNFIARQFEEHRCLIHKNAEKYSWSSNSMGDQDIKDFLDYLVPAHKDNYWMEANDGDKAQYILRAFQYLIEVLSTHYETKQTSKKIIVLSDEFDAPFMKLLFKVAPSDERIIILIRKLMCLLCKDEVSAQFVERVVIFSVTALGGLISLGANNVRLRTFLDKDYDYCKFFGFTKEEVEAIVKRTVTESQRQKAALDEIVVWYDGYIVTGDNDTTICNPVSITHYLPRLLRRNHWVDSVGTKYVHQLFRCEKFREKLFPAIRENHYISINTIQLDDISNLKSLSESISNCTNDKQVDLALQFLTECGYFNVIEKKNSNWILRIPNQELKETFTDKLHYALKFFKTNRFDKKQQKSFVNALESLGEHEPMKYVTFKKSVENLYINRELPKAHFHFHHDLWMLIFGSSEYHSLSEVPTKKGWSPMLDLIFITESGTGIVIEVTRHEQDSAKKGLKQCLEKEYYKAFELEGKRIRVLNTILMGLHLSDNGKVNIRYLENFDSKTLSNEQNRETLIETIVENSCECSDV